MKKSHFIGKILLSVLVVLIPVFIAGLMLIILSDGLGMILGGIAFWGADVWFAIRVFNFIKENKDMLI